MSANAPQLKTLAWRLVVQTEGIEKNTRAAANSLAGFGKSISQLGQVLRGGIFLYYAREVLRIADAYTQMQNKIKLVTKDQAEANVVSAEVIQLALRTRTDLASTVDLYARAARSLQDFGLSQRQVLEFSESVSQAIQVSGATAKEASQGVIQFSQGLQSGKLAGDELRAVLEQTPRLGKALSEGLGIPFKNLRKLASEGKIETEAIFAAMKKEAPKIAAEFAKMTPTFEQGLNNATTGLSVFFGEINKGLGLTEGFASILRDLGTALVEFAPAARDAAVNIKEFITVATVGISMWFSKIGPQFKKWRAENTLEGARADTPQSVIDKAALELAEADAALFDWQEQYLMHLDAIAADFTKLRADLAASKADLNTAGTKKTTAGEEDPKMLEGLDKIEANLAQKFAELEIARNTLTVAMRQGDEAARAYAESEKLTLEIETDLTELFKQYGPLNADRVMGIRNVTSAINDQNTALMSNEQAWSIANSQIEGGKDRYERAQEEVDLLGRALDQLGNELTSDQQYRIERRLRVLSGQISDVAELAGTAFESVVTGLTSFIAGGAQDVKGFIQGMIQELGKLVVKFFLVRAVKGTMFESFFSAKGNVFHSGNPVPFAQGGVVGGPTTFAMSGGRTGMMGEAGPEAVMPLARLPSGQLGVNANPAHIEVINNTGVNATARIQNQGDRTSIILEAAELGAQMAEQRMTRSLRTGYGSASTTLQRTYALRRQG